MFQHTAARRRLHLFGRLSSEGGVVSTHSRAEAAAFFIPTFTCRYSSFNTQPRRGGCITATLAMWSANCFNTQPRRGGCLCTMVWLCFSITCFNTQPRRGGCSACNAATCSTGTFQHTAAQRRLQSITIICC